MSSSWDKINGVYNYYFDELSHPTTKDLFLVPSPIPVLLILVTYFLVCVKIGPYLMKNRQPFELKSVLKLYNIIQVIFSLYMSYEGSVYMFSKDYNFKCQGVGVGEYRIAKAIHMYFLIKIFEMMDTVFFVLRKSDRQITGLHLYHHSIMPFASWIALKYFPGGQSVVVGTVNCYVHVVMYSYYLLSGLGPQYQKYLWWKKYLTLMQLAQFTFLLLQNVNSLFYTCNFHQVLKMLIIIEAAVFLYLFGKFYYYNYIVKDKKKLKIDNDAVTGTLQNNGTAHSSQKSHKEPQLAKRQYVNENSKEERISSKAYSGNSR